MEPSSWIDQPVRSTVAGPPLLIVTVSPTQSRALTVTGEPGEPAWGAVVVVEVVGLGWGGAGTGAGVAPPPGQVSSMLRSASTSAGSAVRFQVTLTEIQSVA